MIINGKRQDDTPSRIVRERLKPTVKGFYGSDTPSRIVREPNSKQDDEREIRYTLTYSEGTH